MNDFFKKFITVIGGSAEIFRSREVLPPSIREVERPDADRPDAEIETESGAGDQDNLMSAGDDAKGKGNVGTGTSTSALGRGIGTDSLVCPYCASKNYTKRGFRQKKLERVQLMLCGDCGKTFTPHLVKGKHYPLATIFDAISLYNLGFSLEESCKRCRPAPEVARPLESGDTGTRGTGTIATSDSNSALGRNNIGTGTSSDGGQGSSTSDNIGTGTISASSLSNWIHEFSDRMPFLRMRDFAMQKYTPFNMVTTATLVHRQLYKFRFHHAKCELIMQENFHHKTFQPLKEFLELVNSECPHQYFSAKNDEVGIMRASELNTRGKSPLTFSKTAMIVRGKRNYATMMAEFVLQSVKDRTKRHEALQKYFLYNDSVTIATEVPVYLTRDDLEHMQSQLGFEVFRPSPDIEKTELLRVPAEGGDISSNVIPADAGIQKENGMDPRVKPEDDGGGDTLNGQGNVGTGQGTAPKGKSIRQLADGIGAAGLPKLITGHIDFLQIRNGMVHILDYKPNAAKEKPIEQLTLYAMALSRLTGLRLFEFKCAWFDEKDYFEFYPLHVLHKPKKAKRRKKVETQEGTYLVNKDDKKIKSLRPI